MGPDILLMVVLAGTIGAAIGTFTGLVPGIHVNTAATILLGAYPVMENIIAGFTEPIMAPVLISCCIMSASVVHSFVDFVPSVFIGVPSEDDVISMLPGHRLLLQGEGMMAVKAAAIGSLVGSVSAIALAIPLQWLMLNGALEYIDYFTEGIIVATLSIIILTSKRPLVSLALILISGLGGVIVNNAEIPMIAMIGGGTMLFPLLTGLFGIPPLLENNSVKNKIVQKPCSDDPVGPIPGIKGVLTGLIAGWFPGVTATAGALLTATFSNERDPARFISMTASIGTVTSVFSIVTLSVSGSGRSGTSMAVKEIIGDSLTGFCSDAFLMILFSIALASAIGYRMTILGGKMMAAISHIIPEKLLNDAVFLLIVILVFLFTGPFGLLVLLISATIGIVPPSLDISRICLTGCLMVPVLL